MWENPYVDMLLYHHHLFNATVGIFPHSYVCFNSYHQLCLLVHYLLLLEPHILHLKNNFCSTTCNMGMSEYTHEHEGPQGPSASAYISGKSQVPMLQLIW